MSELVTVKQLAGMAGLTDARIRQLILEGRIRTSRVGDRLIVIDLQEARRFLGERNLDLSRVLNHPLPKAYEAAKQEKEGSK